MYILYFTILIFIFICILHFEKLNLFIEKKEQINYEQKL